MLISKGYGTIRKLQFLSFPIVRLCSILGLNFTLLLSEMVRTIDSAAVEQELEPQVIAITRGSDRGRGRARGHRKARTTVPSAAHACARATSVETEIAPNGEIFLI